MNLSLIIPVFNSESYIDECIEVILKEIKDDNVEILLIDDGSTDKSTEICKKYKEKNSNVKVFCNSNHGVSYSRNYGIDRAKGEWIMFIDSDDKLLNGWYNIVKQYFQSEEDIIVFSKNIENNMKEMENSVIESIIGMNENKTYLPTPWSKLYRTKFLKENNIKFEEDIINGEDMIFNVKCFLNTKKFTLCNRGIYQYRIHANSATKKFDNRFIKSDLIFQNKLLEILEENEILNDKQKLNIVEFCKKNSIFAIAQRLSYSGSYKTFKKNKKFFVQYFKNQNYKIKLGIKKDIIIILLRFRLYLMVFFILSLTRRKVKKNNTCFVNI